MDLLEISKIMMKSTTGRDWSDEEILDMMREARDKYGQDTKQFQKLDKFIKGKENINERNI